MQAKQRSASGRRPKHDPRESEKEILQAAEQLLRERPFREVTVDEVMRRTGLKRPAFYVHFRDRHDLVLRVVQHIGSDIRAMTERWLNGTDPLNDGREALEGLVDVYVQHGPIMRAIADAAGTDTRVEAMYRGLLQELIDASVKHIREEQRNGKIRKDLEAEETARALIWMDERYLTETLGRTPQADPVLVARVLLNIWVSTLYGNPA